MRTSKWQKWAHTRCQEGRKRKRMTCSEDLLIRITLIYIFCDKVVTTGEIWIFLLYPETNQSCQWQQANSWPLKKKKKEKIDTQLRKFLIQFWGQNGVIPFQKARQSLLNIKKTSWRKKTPASNYTEVTWTGGNIHFAQMSHNFSLIMVLRQWHIFLIHLI